MRNSLGLTLQNVMSSCMKISIGVRYSSMLLTIGFVGARKSMWANAKYISTPVSIAKGNVHALMNLIRRIRNGYFVGFRNLSAKVQQKSSMCHCPTVINAVSLMIR